MRKLVKVTFKEHSPELEKSTANYWGIKNILYKKLFAGKTLEVTLTEDDTLLYSGWMVGLEVIEDFHGTVKEDD